MRTPDRTRAALLVTLAGTLAACATDVDPTGVVNSGTLVAVAEIGGWALPGVDFVASGPSGTITLTSERDGLAVAEGVVPGLWTVRVEAIDADARLDAPEIEVRVLAESEDTARLTGVFDPGRFSTVAVGNASICGLNETRNPYCWGLGEFGELGTGAPGRSARPVRARAPEPLVDLVAGSLHICGLGESGTAYCWGLNAGGRLGIGESEGVTPFATLPTAVAGSVRFSSLVAGVSSVCGLESGTGRAWCWGSATDGQLGNGARSGSSGVPTAVDTDERFVALHAKELWAGPRAVAGRTDDGRIFVWGASPDDGPSWLGYAGPTPVQVPLPGPALASSSVCAQMETDILCWPVLTGDVPPEVLGVLTPTADAVLRTYETEALDPVFFDGGFHCRRAGGAYACTDAWAFPLPTLDFGGETAVQVATFFRGGCAVTDTGRVWCWRGDFFDAFLAAGPGSD